MHYEGQDPQLLQIKNHIILLREKLEGINAAAIAEFDMRMARELRTYRHLRVILLRQEEEQQQLRL